MVLATTARSLTLTALLCGACTGLSGCTSGHSTPYYAFWQKLGYEKRDIFVSDVKTARDEQEKAKEQFKTTLQSFQEVTKFNGGDLEAKYQKLNSEYTSSESRAETVRKKIASVESTSAAMFDEWTKEIGEYSDPKLKASSEQKLAETRERYAKMIGLMKQASSRMDPVLRAFKDQVLFLKHSLNAAAIASLQTTATGIESDVNSLIGDMEKSIAEANDFIGQMK